VAGSDHRDTLEEEKEERMAPFIRITLALLFIHVITFSGCEEYIPHDTRSLIDPAFKRSEVFGAVAGFGTTFAGVPAFLSMLRRKSSVGLNPSMSAIMAIFQLLWIYYGLLIVSRPVIFWNLIGFLINSATVAAYLHFARKEKRPAGA
jgi:MtN3 and saliva related transmembrane protein